MKKLNLSCLLLLLIFSIFAGVGVELARAEIVVTTDEANPISTNVQENSFIWNNRAFVFYCNGSYMVYKSRTNFTLWSSEISIRVAADGDRFSVWLEEDGTNGYIHYAYAVGGSGNEWIYYRKGQLLSDGSISWCAGEQAIKWSELGWQTYAYLPYIATDSEGYPIIVAVIHKPPDGGSSYYRTWVRRSSTKNGTWNTDLEYGWTYTEIPEPDYVWSVNTIIPIQSRKFHVISIRGDGQNRDYYYNGASWSMTQNPLSAAYGSTSNQYLWGAVAESGNDVIHVVYNRALSGYHFFQHKKWNSSGWFYVDPPYSGEGNYTWNIGVRPRLSLNSSDNTMRATWLEYPDANKIYYRDWNGTAWTTPAVWYTETDDIIEHEDFTSMYSSDLYWAVCYITNATSKNVEFIWKPPLLAPPTGEYYDVEIYIRINGYEPYTNVTFAIDSTTYSNGQTASLFSDVYGDYHNLTGTSLAHLSFINWTVTGDLTVSSASDPAAHLFVSGTGTLTEHLNATVAIIHDETIVTNFNADDWLFAEHKYYDFQSTYILTNAYIDTAIWSFIDHASNNVTFYFNNSTSEGVMSYSELYALTGGNATYSYSWINLTDQTFTVTISLWLKYKIIDTLYVDLYVRGNCSGYGMTNSTVYLYYGETDAFGIAMAFGDSLFCSKDNKIGAWGTVYYLPVTARITTIVAYLSSDVGTVTARAGIYRKTDGVSSAVLKGQTTELATIDDTPSWRTFTFSSPSIFSAGNYVLVVHSGGPVNDVVGYYSTSSNHRIEYDVPDTYSDGLSDPFGTSDFGLNDKALSIYAEYQQQYSSFWTPAQEDYMNLYSQGGAEEMTTSGQAGRLIGGDYFNLYAYNNSYAKSEIYWRNLVHVKILLELGWIFDYPDYPKPMWRFGFDYYARGSWVEGFQFYCQLEGFAYGADWQYAHFSAAILEGSVPDLIWSGDLYTFFDVDRGGSKVWLDLWFNKVNASSVWGMRLTSYYYAVQNNADWVKRTFTGNDWGVYYANMSEIVIFGELQDTGGTKMFSSEISLVKAWHKLTQGIEAYNNTGSTDNIQQFDYTFSIDMQGIPTPSFEAPRTPAMPMGGFLGVLASWLSALVNALAPAFAMVWTGIVWMLDEAIGWVTQGAVTNGFSSFVTMIVATSTSVLSFMTDLALGFVDFATAIGYTVSWFFTNLFSSIWGIFNFLLLTPSFNVFGAFATIVGVSLAWLGGTTYTNAWGQVYDFSYLSSMTIAGTGFSGGIVVFYLIFVCGFFIQILACVGTMSIEPIAQPIRLFWGVIMFMITVIEILWNITTGFISLLVQIVQALRDISPRPLGL